MAVEKFSISMPEELVSDIDELAADRGLTRSGFIREVAAEYVSEHKSAEYEEARRQRIHNAIEGMQAMADRWADDPKLGVEYIREDREESQGGPWKYPSDDE